MNKKNSQKKTILEFPNYEVKHEREKRLFPTFNSN